MITRPPPRAATWLLERLGDGIRFDSLIGDLTEQFAAGRSRFWYWWQTTGVVAQELVRVVRAHALSFSAATLSGYALMHLWELASAHVYQPVYASLPQVHAHHWTAQILLRVAAMQLNGVSNCVLTFATVWVVIRIHRAHPRAALVAFVVVLTVPLLPGVARELMVATAHAPVSLALIPLMLPAALQATVTLAEGLWLIRAQRYGGIERRTRRVTVAVAVIAVLVASIYRARLVGALPLSRPEWYVLDLLDIAGVAYLAVLLWRTPRASMTRTAYSLRGTR
ncbi:MAG TPA: hypothetical protein VGV09_03620 [Steroidobacteraceae bacterium]|nr:hypothetical protein [Steroidobacteraceae bacterium]